MTELSDELLVAYVDGQLARDQSKAIKRVLDNDDVAAARVEALRATQKKLEAAFEAMLADELTALTGSTAAVQSPAFPVEPLRRPAPRQRKMGIALAACVAFALLALGVWAPYLAPVGELLPLPPSATKVAAPVVTASLPPAPKGWLADVANGHTLLARESLEVSPESQSNADLAYFQITKAISPTVIIPDLSQAGLGFRRAQVLRREGDPVAQIAYLPDAGPPVALYAKANRSKDTPFIFDDVKGIATASWTQKDVSYVLAGLMPRQKMERLAATVYDQVAAAADQPPPEAPASAAVPAAGAEPADAQIAPAEAPAATAEPASPPQQ
ncbi:MAG: hypothetical protein VX871_11690 [Pseudomonadota bacterium]|nr:hypothetical protein [Pseudomonadota bacterium]